MNIPIPQQEQAHLKEWSDQPTPADIEEISSLYEAFCHIDEFDPKKGTETLRLTNFLFTQDLTGDKLLSYHRLITEEIERRYPDAQLDLAL